MNESMNEIPIPEEETWVFKNKHALESIKRGLSQKGTVDRGSFAQYLEDNQESNHKKLLI